MGSSSQVQPFFQFVKGLVTEASPLTYPENATIDEENYELNFSGKRTRRLGIDYEDGSVDIDTEISISASFKDKVIQTYRWDNVANDPTKSFLVVRVGSKIGMFDLYEDAQSDNEITVASIPYISGTDPIGFTVVNGDLIMAVKNIRMFIFYYDGSTVQHDYASVMVRDLWGVYEDINTDTRPESADYTDEHHYNLLNQGWSEERILEFAEEDTDTWSASTWITSGSKVRPTASTGYYYRATSTGNTGSSEPTWPLTVGSTVTDSGVTWVNDGLIDIGVYPSNADLVSMGAKSDGSWDAELISDYLLGTTPAPKGKFVINLATRGSGRENSVDASLSLPLDWEGNNFTCVGSYAGRLFISGMEQDLAGGDELSPNLSGMIFYSKLVNSREDLGKCYQEADPTAEEINELIATDGGYIQIPEASSIHRLESVSASLFVFAENGVWEIRGGESGFSAVDNQVNKITNIGSVSSEAIVNAEGTLFYFAKSGIYSIEPDQTQTIYIAKNISETTIQTKYLTIPSEGKSKAKGHYSAEDRVVRWIYNSDTDEDKYVYDKELVLDLRLGAFYQLGYTQVDDNCNQICSIYSTPNFKAVETDDPVTDNTGNLVVDGSGNTVTVPLRSRVNSLTKLKYMSIRQPTTGNWTVNFCERSNESFVDWYSYDSTGVDASAYMVTGYNISGDSMRYKQVPYVTVHFQRTETGFDAAYDSLNESSCLITPYWDWADSDTGGKIGNQFQAYRLSRNYVPASVSDSFNYGQAVMSTKNKLRGRGRAISLRFDTEAGKDCQLLGWSLVVTGNTVV